MRRVHELVLIAALLTVLVAGLAILRYSPFTRAVSLQWSYSQALASGGQTLAEVSEFERLIPHASHRIEYFTEEQGTPKWHSQGGIGSRFIIHMEVDIQINRESHTVTAAGFPTFSISEVESMHIDPRGSVSVIFSTASWQFGPAEWRRIVDAQGDVETVLGVPVSSSTPIENFERALR